MASNDTFIRVSNRQLQYGSRARSTAGLLQLLKSVPEHLMAMGMATNQATSVAFHPHRPSVVAAGTNYGQIYVWDLDRCGDGRRDQQGERGNTDSISDALVFRTIADQQYAHGEGVYSLQWLPRRLDAQGISDSEMLLCASSTDGKCLLWDPFIRETGRSRPTPLTGFTIPRKKANKWLNRDGMLEGCRSVGAPVADNAAVTHCILGGEAGSVARIPLRLSDVLSGEQLHISSTCTWKGDALGVLRGVPEEAQQKLIMHVEAYCAVQGINQVTTEIIYGSQPPCSLVYPPPAKSATCQGHTPSTPVTAVAFSPFISRAYATGGADGKVMIFNGVVGTAVLTLCPSIEASAEDSPAVTALSWSCSRPAVLGVALMASRSGTGGVLFYDLSKPGPRVPVVSIAMDGGCVALSSNPTQRQLWAAVNGKGEAQMLRVGFGLSDRLTGEESVLKRLLEAPLSSRLR
ncbi:hypothetical protein FOZ61_006269 [Perkinsus olseni]|uniref:Guanine nucleotide-binding protein subunit beta-like protein n=1 Tax=Perkinsus olseni TaxID=32597 RepID=A0A7J6LDW7_PEROL|nr:hypothetical protein FOZ61_006269 [Perkinsus olseni]